MDPLYRFHVEQTFAFEWGHIFEPIPEYFHLLEANMRPFDYVTCHMFAVDDSAVPGEREFHYVSHADVKERRLPQSSQGLGSFSRDRNPLGRHGYNARKLGLIEPYIRTTKVQTQPAVDVAREYADANLLLTDCEGYDVEIISSALICPDFRPKVIQFEKPRDNNDFFQSTLELLRALEYQVHWAKDVICER